MAEISSGRGTVIAVAIAARTSTSAPDRFFHRHRQAFRLCHGPSSQLGNPVGSHSRHSYEAPARRPAGQTLTGGALGPHTGLRGRTAPGIPPSSPSQARRLETKGHPSPVKKSGPASRSLVPSLVDRGPVPKSVDDWWRPESAVRRVPSAHPPRLRRENMTEPTTNPTTLRPINAAPRARLAAPDSRIKKAPTKRGSDMAGRNSPRKRTHSAPELTSGFGPVRLLIALALLLLRRGPPRPGRHPRVNGRRYRCRFPLRLPDRIPGRQGQRDPTRYPGSGREGRLRPLATPSRPSRRITSKRSGSALRVVRRSAPRHQAPATSVPCLGGPRRACGPPRRQPPRPGQLATATAAPRRQPLRWRR